ncbi:hypothetical protein CNMCM7691_004239 [Aspergillus felis]|uniref:Uncharacterized protein n=1 Tax=Aspergillus felis TaxID=1287682 RepID=A0A8H6R4W9_9EURO|nr:hypothetical protein CNMCM7691_004239 [Aspergillus felis]
MTRLPGFFTALYILCSLPGISAWTFVWRNVSDTPTVEEGTGAQPCKAIDHAKGKYFKFDAGDSLVRIYLYGSSSCTDGVSWTAENSLAKNSSSPIRAFAVIDLRGANTSTSSELESFPGNDWFKSSPNSPIVTAMGKRLVDEDCGKYKDGPGPQWTEADRASYQCWQQKLGYTAADADGWPGKTSWDQLKVPLTQRTASSTTAETPSNTRTETPSNTRTETPSNTSTGTPTGMFASDTTASTRSSLGPGEIAGVVVGSVVGLGLISAIIYLARLIGRRSALGSKEEETERKQERGGDDSDDHDVDDAAVAEEAKSVEKLPLEAEAIPANNPKKYFAELPGDTATAELSDSRRIFELEDARTYDYIMWSPVSSK